MNETTGRMGDPIISPLLVVGLAFQGTSSRIDESEIEQVSFRTRPETPALQSNVVVF